MNSFEIYNRVLLEFWFYELNKPWAMTTGCHDLFYAFFPQSQCAVIKHKF